MKKQLLHLLLFLFPVLACAQPLCQVTHFTTNNGLSQGVVSNVFQDKDGYIWFATWNGLERFDGYTFKHYKAYPGDNSPLSTNRFTNIAPTANGNIWCQTYDQKLYLFDVDEERFVEMKFNESQQTAQPYNVRRIYPLRKGVTWVECVGGSVFRIDEKAARQGRGIELYSMANQRLKGIRILSIQQDLDGDEWVMTDQGVTLVGHKRIDSDYPFKEMHIYQGITYLTTTDGRMAIYQPKTGKVKFITLPILVQDIIFVNALPGTKDSICLGTTGGLMLYVPSKKECRLFRIGSPSGISGKVTHMYRDHNRQTWVCTEQPGVFRIDLHTGVVRHYQSPSQTLYSYEFKNRPFFYEDSNGTLWVVPEKGNLCYYDPESDALKLFYTTPGNTYTLYAPYVRTAFVDRQRNVWILHNRGMDKLSFFSKNYELQPVGDGIEPRAFLSDRENHLWTAYKKGTITLFDSKTGTTGYLSSQGVVIPHETNFGSMIYCFLEDKDGNVWMGSKKDGLFLLRKKGDKAYEVHHYVHRPESPYSLSCNSVYALCQDRKGRIWVGTFEGGLNLMQPQEDGSVRFIHRGNRLKSFPSSSTKIRTLATAADGVVLVGTTNGLLTFSDTFDHPEEIKFYRNMRMPNLATSLCSNDVMHICVDSRKDVYVLTFTGGVNKVLSSNLLTDSIRFRAYTTRNGLASDLVNSMIEDAEHQLWVVSENSLSMFDRNKGTFDNFGSKFLHRDFYFSEAIPVLDDHKNLVLGSDKGVLSIAPGQMRKSHYVPHIVLNGVRIQGASSPLAVNDLKELRLSPSERNFSVQFAAIDFVNPEDIEYAYRLEGLETEWNEADKSRSATYINLPPGDYRLQIRSTNSDGVWTNNQRTLPIKVLPTFWETGWAWLVYALLFVAFTSVVVYILFYIYRLRHQVNVEQQLADIKLRFFTDISHELRTPLTLIASPVNEVLEHEPLSSVARQNLSLVHRNTERMLRLVNQILDFRKIQNKKMKLLLEKTDVQPMLHRIAESFDSMAEEKHIRFDLDMDKADEALQAWIDRDKFEKIFFNLLSNAFKYTPAGKSITLSLRTSGNEYRIAVRDEGIGIDPKKRKALFQRFETFAPHSFLQLSSGIGLSLVRELVELHHGKIEVESVLGEGSCFTVTLPLGEEVFQEDPHAEFILDDSVSEPSESASSVLDPTSALSVNMEDKGNDESDNSDVLSSDAPTVLVVEDNEELRLFIHNILSDTYRVLTASNGQEGLQCALEQSPDLIVSDVMMPVMDGLDMVKGIKENPAVCHIPIILLSAKSSLDDRIAGLEQGIDDYITKPFSATYLKVRIQSLLTQRKQWQEAFLASLSPMSGGHPLDRYMPSQPNIAPQDEQFMEEVMKFMEEQMDNSELTVDIFAEHLGLSRTIFFRKLKAIVGIAPVDFIRNMRIKRAAQLIDSGAYNFSEVTYMIGFSDPKYFSKWFKKQMGMTPSEYKDRADKGQSE